jgi:hypothetical protein
MSFGGGGCWKSSIFKETRAIFKIKPKQKLYFREGIKTHNWESIAGFERAKPAPDPLEVLK